MIIFYEKRFLRPSKVCVITDFGKGKTIQSAKDECDINKILKRAVFGELVGQDRQSVFADVSDGLDYMAALNKVRAAEEYYNSMPSEIRDKYPTVEMFLDAEKELMDQELAAKAEEERKAAEASTAASGAGQ